MEEIENNEVLEEIEECSEVNAEALEEDKIPEEPPKLKRKGSPRRETEASESGLKFKVGSQVRVSFSCYSYYGGFPVGNSIRGNCYYVMEYNPEKQYVKVADNLNNPRFIHEFNESSIIPV